jgi:alpha-1,3-mannosyl-glycoprotein beta-1,2-N-acetylglucosaminyltransferase
MDAGAVAMERDPTLWCVSAWSDNGMKDRVRDSGKVYRSDFFPGLGWMMPRRIWEEIGHKYTFHAHAHIFN